MRAIFISDAHLRRADDERYIKLLNFFNEMKEGKLNLLMDGVLPDKGPVLIDDLFIAGDFFDFWFCNKENIYSEFKPVINKLTELQKSGVRIHLGEGNHDFFMGEYFRDVLGMDVFDETMSADLDNLRVLIAHGDTMDSNNTRYLFLRKILRSRAFYNFQRFIPASLRWRLAEFTSRASKEMNPEDGKALAQKMLSLASAKYQQGYDAVILGHCHVPMINHCTVAGEKKIFVTLGDWVSYCSFLYYENNNFYLRNYNA